jgi:hypothetical protein
MAERIVDYLRDSLRRREVQRNVWAIGLYTLATLVITYPVGLRLNAVLAGFPARDGWQYAWWLWFARRLLLEGRGLGQLYLMNHPVGLVHPYQWTLVWLSVLSVPLGSLLSPAATFNVMVLSSFILSGLAAYHLCWALTKNHWAALVGGAIFAFAPNRQGHAMAGWLPQMSVYLYPWYALALIRVLRRPTFRRALVLGLLTGAAALVYVMHIAYFLIPLTAVIVGADLLQRRRAFFTDHRLQYLTLALIIALLVVLPFTLPLLLERFHGESGYLWTHGIVQHSTDLLAFLTPSPYHPLLGRVGLVPAFARDIFPDAEELRWNLAYLGLLPTLLGFWAMIRSRPRPWRWLVLTLGVGLLSLGPILVVGGEPIQYVTDGYEARALMPYALVRQIPLLDWGRTPERLNAVGMLGLGVLAAMGLADLLPRLGDRRWWPGVLGLSAVGLILFEFLSIWPFPTGDATIPPVIETISEQAREGALLHLPMERRRVNHRALYFQTATEQPIVGGEVLRMLPQTPPWWRTIEGLVQADPAPDIVPRPGEPQRLAWLRHFDVDWVLLHRLEPSDEAKYRPYLEDLLGPAIAEDATLAAFSVPEDVPTPEDSRLYTFDEASWRRPEQDGEIWRRWMRDDGRLYVYSTREEVGSLRFAVDSHLDFPTLEVYRDEEPLDTFMVGERTTYTTQPFTLTQGINVFRFHSPVGCPEVLDDSRCWRDALLAPPEEGLPPCDARTTCRTFVFDTLSFIPEQDLPRGQAARVNFGNEMRLRGWDLETTTLDPGDTLTVRLTWEAIVRPSNRHVVFAHLLSPEGELMAQNDDAPVGSVVPQSTWAAGATFKYPLAVELPGDLPAGDYRLLVGVYLWPDVELLPILSDVSGTENDAIELGRVEVGP